MAIEHMFHRTCSMAIEYVLYENHQGVRWAEPSVGLGAARPQYCREVWGAAQPAIPKLKSCVLRGDISLLIIETK